MTPPSATTAHPRGDDTSEPGRVLTGAFVAITGVALVYFLSLGVIQPVVPEFVSTRLHGTGTAVGIAVGAFTLSACLFRLPAARVMERWGARWVTVAGVAIVAASIACYGMASSIGGFIALRAITGVGEAAAFIGVSKAAFDLSAPERRAESTSYFTVAIFAGLAVGPILGEEMRARFAYSMVWAVAALLLVTTALLAALQRAPQRPSTRALSAGDPRLGAEHEVFDHAGTWRDMFHLQAHTRHPGAILALSMFGYASVATLLPLYVTDVGLDSAGIVLAENALLVVGFRLAGASIPRRLGVFGCTLGSLSLQSVGWLILATVPTATGMYTGMVPISVGVSLLYPALFSFAVARAPEAERPQAVAAFTLYFDLAAGAGAVALGALLSLASFGVVFICAAALNLTGIALLLRARTTYQSPATPGSDSPASEPEPEPDHSTIVA